MSAAEPDVKPLATPAGATARPDLARRPALYAKPMSKAMPSCAFVREAKRIPETPTRVDPPLAHGRAHSRGARDGPGEALSAPRRQGVSV